MALFTRMPLSHAKILALRGDDGSESDDLDMDDNDFSLDDRISSVPILQSGTGISPWKEPGHSILKSHSAVSSEEDISTLRKDSEPMDMPAGRRNRETLDGIGQSPSLASLGVSPGTGSMADMWRLWADDASDAVADYLTIAPPARRSLSLKAKKTPPGTPSPKKMVRFADAMGLDLEKVRHFMQDQIPNTPATAAIAALRPPELSGPVSTLTNDLDRHTSGRYLTPAFPQPCLAGNFLERIRTAKICLDSVQTQDFTVHGIVRVLNVSFEKSVMVRYTFDGWRTSMDMAGQYVANSNDNFSDRFQFTLTAPPYLNLGQTLQFALCYHANGQEYWDSNYGQNYCLTCCAGAASFNGLPSSPSTNAFL